MKIKNNYIKQCGLTLIFALIAFSSVKFFTSYNRKSLPVATVIQAVDSPLKLFTTEELKAFDGTNPNKPIYIGLDGLIYDVSLGKSYYQTGGVYHYLAGKDSSVELHIAGGGIIKQKYPVVGKLQ